MHIWNDRIESVDASANVLSPDDGNIRGNAGPMVGVIRRAVGLAAAAFLLASAVPVGAGIRETFFIYKPTYVHGDFILKRLEGSRLGSGRLLNPEGTQDFILFAFMDAALTGAGNGGMIKTKG